MNEPWQMEPIGRIESPYREGFGIPRQSGIVPAATGVLVPTGEWADPSAWQGIEAFSHLWLLWVFHAKRRMQATDRKAVRPPRLGGNERVGVFASRAPIRPNPIGLSVVGWTCSTARRCSTSSRTSRTPTAPPTAAAAGPAGRRSDWR